MVSHGQKGYFPSEQSPGSLSSSQQQTGPQPFSGFKLAGTPQPPQPPRRPGPKRWTVQQLRASDAIIPLQSGTNQFASQRGMTGFGQPRNTTTPVYGGMEIPQEPEAPRPSDAVVPLQYGTNQYATQAGMTGFGQPRDVAGKHLHRVFDDDGLPPQNGNASWQ